MYSCRLTVWGVVRKVRLDKNGQSQKCYRVKLSNAMAVLTESVHVVTFFVFICACRFPRGACRWECGVDSGDSSGELCRGSSVSGGQGCWKCYDTQFCWQHQASLPPPTTTIVWCTIYWDWYCTLSYSVESFGIKMLFTIIIISLFVCYGSSTWAIVITVHGEPFAWNERSCFLWL